MLFLWSFRAEADVVDVVVVLISLQLRIILYRFAWEGGRAHRQLCVERSVCKHTADVMSLCASLFSSLMPIGKSQIAVGVCVGGGS